MVESADKYVLAGSTGAENQGVLESVGLIENHAYAILAVVCDCYLMNLNAALS